MTEGEKKTLEQLESTIFVLSRTQLKNLFITRVFVGTDAYLYNSKWYPKDFLKAILLLQVQTAAFLFTLCLMSTLFGAGESFMKEKVRKNICNCAVGIVFRIARTLKKKIVPLLIWATAMSSSKGILHVSRCQKDLFWKKMFKNKTRCILNPALLDWRKKKKRVIWKEDYF